MAFSEDTKQAAYERAGGRCECLRQSCSAHPAGRCGRLLMAGWHAHHVRAPSEGGSDEPDNCEALCIPCHERGREGAGAEVAAPITVAGVVTLSSAPRPGSVATPQPPATQSRAPTTHPRNSQITVVLEILVEEVRIVLLDSIGCQTPTGTGSQRPPGVALLQRRALPRAVRAQWLERFGLHRPAWSQEPLSR